MTLRLAPDAATRRHLADVARGVAVPDLVLRGGALVDVYTDEVLEGWGVAVAGDRIASLGPAVDTLIGEETRVIELDGRIVAPGLVEGHTHLVRASISELVCGQLAAGVTTTIAESMELALAGGVEAVQDLLREAAGVPGRAFLTLGGILVPDDEVDARVAPAPQWERLLDDHLVAGVGEMYWAEVLRGHGRTEQLVQGALERGLTVEGHGAGARHPALAALAALGATADHEGIDGEDLRTRLRLGLWAEARHGSTRQDLDRIAPLWQDGHLDLSRLTLTCDGVEPDQLLRQESLNAVVERAVELGLPFARAVRLASRGPAERFGIARWLGGITPGAFADLVILPRDDRFRPDRVLVGGREPVPAAVAGSGGPSRARPLQMPREELLQRPPAGRWRAMQLSGPTVTREVESDGTDALLVVALDRGERCRGACGLLLGFGMDRGAVAWTTGWEAPGPVACGSAPEELRHALSALRDLGAGGVAVVAGGRVFAAWRADVAGIVSSAPLPTIVRDVEAVQAALRSLGAITPNPMLTLETLTTTAIPFLRLTASGYYRARDGSRPGLAW